VVAPIAGKKKARNGKTDGPIFGTQEKPMPVHNFRVLSPEKKPERTHINITAPGDGKMEMAQESITTSAGAQAISTRKKFALHEVPKEIRVATTQAVNIGSTFVVLHVGKDSNLQNLRHPREHPLRAFSTIQ
jgi:hypothetical protein